MKIFLVILATIDFIWLRSSYGKVSEGVFPQALGSTLTKFASNNPYPPVKDFLNAVAIPNSVMFGWLTMWGELAVALSLAVVLVAELTYRTSVLTRYLAMAGLLGGMFLNIIFWLASGWTSPSTDGLNLLMFFVQLTFFVYYAKNSR